MGLDELRYNVKAKLLRMRSIHRLIETAKFKDAFNRAELGERESVLIFISQFEIEKLEDWLERHRDMSPQNLSMRELRELAKQKGVIDYQYLTKAMLLSEIQNVR